MKGMIVLLLIFVLPAICGVVDQSRIEATELMNRLWPPQRATSFSFVRPACKRDAVSVETWDVFAAGKANYEVWTIYYNGGYAITRGE